MAYGVKYRLEFSDVLGNGKKIEIEKDGFSGTVLPLVGTAEPVVIKWDGDEDFYSPIIGSTCTLNLFVTDEVQYENFYAFDEEEFKVKIYYKDDANVYQLYWVGFIVTDSYKQALSSPPYQITIQAHDGLGLLDSKEMEILDSDNFLNTNETRDLVLNLVNDAISKTNLGLNVVFNTNMTIGSSTNPQDFPGGNRFSKYTNDLQVIDCKTYIENVLKTLNARIFQAHGQWCIVSNSEYIDHDFYDDQVDGTIQSNIRFAETKMLQTTGSESPEFQLYNSSGSFIFNTSEDVLLKTKTDLTPLNNDLVVEYIPPAKIVQNKLDLTSKNLFGKILNEDPLFENPTSGWTITSNRATVGNFDFVLSGEKSIRTSQSTQSTTTFTQMFSGSTPSNMSFQKNYEIEFEINYFLDGSLSSNDTPFAINYNIVRTYNTNFVPQVEYWDTENSEWSQSATNNKEVVETANTWQSFTVTTKEELNRSSAISQLILYLPYKHSGTSMTHLYFDDRKLKRVTTLFDTQLAIQKRTVNSKLIESEYKPYNAQIVLYRARDFSPLQTRFLEQTITQQKINDFRTHVSRYEGTFYNNLKKPVSPKNKIWIDFTKAFLEYVDVTPTPSSVNITYVDGGQEQNRIYTNDSVASIDVDDIVTSSIISSGTTVLVTQVVTGSPNYVVIDTNLQISVGDVFTITEPQQPQDADRIYSNDSVANISVGDFVTGGPPQNPITTDIQVTQVVTGSPNYVVIDTNLQLTDGEVFAFTEKSFINNAVSNDYLTHEPVSCMIDSMEYNVKANTVSVVMHVPNQDDDVQTNYITKFE